MAEWLYERGVGEERAALVADGEIIEARVRRDDDRPALGAVVKARLVSRADNGVATVEATAGRWKIRVAGLPRDVAVGTVLPVEITREMIAERGGHRPAHGRPAEPGRAEEPGPGLLAELERSGLPVATMRSHEPDRIEEAGWSEIVDQTRTGEIAFPGGRLLLHLTPAMTLFDVDGTLPPARLAIAGAEAAGRAIRRLDVAGSIGIDLPTLGRAERQAAAAALDAVLPPPFERTAVNGFGFLQIVRRRVRASLPELVQHDPFRTGALELARRALRAPGAGRRTLACDRRTAAHLHPLLPALERATGRPHIIREDPNAPWNGHVEVEHP